MLLSPTAEEVPEAPLRSPYENRRADSLERHQPVEFQRCRFTEILLSLLIHQV